MYSDNSIMDDTMVIKLKMSVFNFMSSNQVVKVQCTVTNSMGDLAYDIYEFYLNTPPNKGTMEVFIVGDNSEIELTNNNAYMIQPLTTVLHIKIRDWYDTEQDFQQELLFSVRLAIEDYSYQLTDQTSDEDIYFKLPVLSNKASLVNATIYLVAQDQYQSISQDKKDIFNAPNPLYNIEDYNNMIDKLDNLNFTNNIDHILFAAQSLALGMADLERLPSYPGICALDIHCNMQGRCTSETGIQRCVCN